ncbi:MAG: Gfo/Idh/MocA family oxidoreductase [Deltaproteobacteria bacterium]|nr:Gfo/Idh/MocA family oxidoreductase [Deltaproteobacteria bacterium]
MRPIKVGVVGVGYLGRFHTEKYAQMEGVHLVGVADVDSSRADSIATQYGTKPFYRAQDLLPHVDAVSIVVPTSQHFEIASPFLAAGKDVLLEKPISASVAEADQLIQQAEEHRCIFQVGHLERFNPAIQKIQPMLQNPRFIEVHRMGPFPERNYDVDVILDLMIHDIDLILTWVASPIQSIDAVGVPVISKNVDIANVRLRFLNGCTANITASRASLERQRKFRIFQSDFYASINFEEPSVMVCRRVGGSQDEAWPQIEAETFTFEKADLLREELRSFIASVRERGRPLVTGREARAALEVALKIQKEIGAFCP